MLATQVALAVAIDENKDDDQAPAQSSKGSIRAAIQNERRNIMNAKSRGEAISIEMQELQRAYAQFGHLRCAECVSLNDSYGSDGVGVGIGAVIDGVIF